VTLEALRCFTTHEEWSGRVPAAMYQNDKTLTPEQQKEIDQFLYPQLGTKNGKMISQHSSIRIMDRAYLDLFAFSKGETDISRKAADLKTYFKNWAKPFEDGHIFFLVASGAALEERLAKRGALRAGAKKVRFDAKTLQQQDSDLRKIYKPQVDSIIDTTDCSPGEAARQIARAILLDSYSSFQFEKRLEEVIANGGVL